MKQRDPITKAAVAICAGVMPARVLGSRTVDDYWDLLPPDAQEVYRTAFLSAMEVYNVATESEWRNSEEQANHRAAAEPDPF